MKLFSLPRSFGFRQAMLLTSGCFVLIALGVTGITLVSRNYSRQGTRQTETLTSQFLPGLVSLAHLQAASLNLKSITFQLAMAKDETSMTALKQAFQVSSAHVNDSVAELRLLINDEPTQRLIAAFADDEQSYRQSAEKFQTQLRADEFEKAMATLDQQVVPAQQKIETQIIGLSQQYFQLSRNAGARTTALLSQSDHFGLLATIVLAGFTLLCLGLSLAATRALIVQVQKREAERQAAQDTLEKRVEDRTAALRSSEERIRLVVDTASDAIITADAAGAITAWNRQAEKTFGWTPDEALGRNLAETLIAPRHREAHCQRLEKFFASSDSAALNQCIEITALHMDGHDLPVEIAISPLCLGDTVLFSAFIRDISDRKRAEAELRDIHRQLVETSRQAGMAEVATGVLHNVGNVLNSVNVSATLVADQVRHSKASNVAKLSVLFEQHKANLAEFLTKDPRGQMIPGYLNTLSESLEAEQKTITTELEDLRKNIEHIKDIVAMQQSYARTSGVTETVSVPDLVEDALRINAGSLARHDVDAKRDYQARPVVTTDKHKVMQILINLVRNAKYACDESGRTDKCIIVRTTADEHSVKIAVIDNGVGIPPENLTRIFNHGFTTRKAGHGFGLHSGALAAKELGGSLTALSDGPGHGATFILALPFKTEPSSHEKFSA